MEMTEECFVSEFDPFILEEEGSVDRNMALDAPLEGVAGRGKGLDSGVSSHTMAAFFWTLIDNHPPHTRVSKHNVSLILNGLPGR